MYIYGNDHVVMLANRQS